MHRYGHPVGVRKPKHVTSSCDVIWPIQVNVRIAEMQLDSRPEMGVFGTPGQFGDGVILQRIDAAKPKQAIRISTHLLAGPIVLGLDPIQLVCDRRSVWVAELIRNGKHHGSLNVRLIQQLDQVRSLDARDGRSRELATKQMLVMIDQRCWRRGPGLTPQQEHCTEDPK